MIPDYDPVNHVIPPFITNPTERSSMSPYRASMSEFVKKFSISPERREILGGLLNYRARLIQLGFNEGWQWLDGSFATNVELIHSRPPRDIDVVTFAKAPAYLGEFDEQKWDEFLSSNLELFLPQAAKDKFHCDAYFIDLDKQAEMLVDDTRYFFGLFSHRRNPIVWKGMILVPLSSDDAEARTFLDQARQSC